MTDSEKLDQILLRIDGNGKEIEGIIPAQRRMDNDMKSINDYITKEKWRKEATKNVLRGFAWFVGIVGGILGVFATAFALIN